MKYSFLENNNNKYNNKFEDKKHLFEYDQFADDEEYDEEIDDYDPEVAKLLDYKLKNVNKLNDILFDDSISLEEKKDYIKINKDLLNKIDKYGDTALMFACKNAEIESLTQLQEKYEQAICRQQEVSNKIQETVGELPTA